MGFYGEVVSAVEEDFYVIKDSGEEDDEENAGANRSGIYSVLFLFKLLPFLYWSLYVKFSTCNIFELGPRDTL